jgi:hypothetical protein
MQDPAVGVPQSTAAGCLSRNELLITDTENCAITATANTGFNRIPKKR